MRTTRLFLTRPGMIFARTGTTIAMGLTLCVAGCKSTPPATTDANTIAASSGADPATINMAPVEGTSYAPAPVQRQPKSQVLGSRSEYAPAPATSQEYPQQYAAQQNGYPQDQTYDPNYENQVDAGQDALYAEEPPPPLPVYEQPEDVNPNDLWTPGYWSYGQQGYYWVPGAWVAAPYAGALWTPGYWGYGGNRYAFHHGFWGTHIGFYGGVPYGFGYTGVGYSGGYWNGNNFYYNRTVNRINTTNIRNVYVHNVTIVNNYNHVSYNGGRGGIPVRPQPAELAAMRGPRTPPMQAQVEAARSAAQNRQQFFAENHGRPAVVAAARPYQADHVAPPANLEQVRQQNQQRLQQLNGQPRLGQNQPTPQRTEPNQPQQRMVQNQQLQQQQELQNRQNNVEAQHQQQVNQQRTQENVQQQRVQQQNAQRTQQQQQVVQQKPQPQNHVQPAPQAPAAQHQQQLNQQRAQENTQQQQRVQQENQQRVQQENQQRVQQQNNAERTPARPQQPAARPQVEQHVTPQVQAPRPTPQPQVQAPRPAPPQAHAQPTPQPRPAQPRPAPAPQQHSAPQPHEEGHPRG